MSLKEIVQMQIEIMESGLDLNLNMAQKLVDELGGDCKLEKFDHVNTVNYYITLLILRRMDDGKLL
jgi:hypothetical protein|tara:strand:+ start:1843 stop:2040 length:198 start_codon:yes stop_codon:yes gene_type:complete